MTRNSEKVTIKVHNSPREANTLKLYIVSCRGVVQLGGPDSGFTRGVLLRWGHYYLNLTILKIDENAFLKVTVTDTAT